MILKHLAHPIARKSQERLNQFDPTFVPVFLQKDDIARLPDKTFEISAGDKTYHVDCIVNVTGHGRHNSKILEKMKKDDLVAIDPKLGVLATDETGYRLKGSYIACIGPATHFGIDGIETFAKPAEKLAQETISQIN